MTRGRARIHLPGDKAHAALCGWTYVDVEADVSLVTCKTCLSMLAAGRSAPRCGRAAGRATVASAELGQALGDALRATAMPSAGPPPRVTPQIWATSCKGGEHRRCGVCELCAWEREAGLWAAVAPWNRAHQIERPDSAPRWPSLAAALVALVEWERHGRTAPSAFGGMLDCLRRGDLGDGGRSRPDDPLLRRGGELVRVRQALELAYPEEGHGRLSAEQCRGLLLVRTPGVLIALPTYEELAAEVGEPVGELRALVRSGRAAVSAELAKRGLIPREPPRARRRVGVGASAMRVREAEVCV